MIGLTGDRWRVLSPLLDEAPELAPPERTAWLSGLKQRDAAIAADIRAMLEEHDALSARGFLEAGVGLPPAKNGDPLTGNASSKHDFEARRLGPYRLVRELGAGGMGVVWLAQQEQPIRRLVAIKAVRPGADSRQVLSRFEAERQALAILNHPGIAKVFEAGATSDGRPYFVMEHIAGSSITDFDAHRLTIAERLQVFLQVCDAVHHAHQKGVLHRDLKPRNILVSDEDGRYAVKVIDFGVAKAIGQHLTGDTLQTEIGAIVGTPGYMSPEQAGLVNATVNTRTDVYSLGLILYELLTGTPAFDHGELRRKTVLEALRVIRETEPPSLTTRLAKETDKAMHEVAGKRRAEPRALLRQLRGDLEWITGRAIEKDPDRRYPSVAALRADVERHLKGEPVLAGPPSAIYRIRKLAHRHRRLAAAVLIIASAVTLSAVVSTIALVRGQRRVDPTQGQPVRSAVAPSTAETDTASMPLPFTSFEGTEMAAAWSPDGRQVAFMWNGEKEDNFDIYVLQPGTSRPLRVTTDAGVDADPAWSPDGRWIAYAHTAPDWRYSLKRVSSVGGPDHTLITDSTRLGGPTWTPDGQALVVLIVRQPNELSELWAISAATGERRQLTFPPAGVVGDLAPAISPDGRTLAFCRKTAWRTAELFLLDLQPDLSPAGEPRRVTDLGYVDRPAWTPDGARILFEAHGEDASIWQLDVKSRRVRPVVGPPLTAMQPAIAKRPGGHSSLVFTNEVAERSIWRYSTRLGPGGPPVELVPSTRSQALPRYSSEGRRIAFSSTRSGYQEIWVANADGSQPVQLTALRHQLTEMGHWSPTDDVIAFESQGRDRRQIYIVSSSGGSAVPITNEEGVQYGGGWSRDGSAYYYTSSRSGRSEVWKASRHGGPSVQLTLNGGLNGFESNRGVFYYWREHHAQPASLIGRMPDGDREVPLVPRGLPGSVLAPQGFYYIATGTLDVYQYDERTGRSARVLNVPKPPFREFTISPDGRWFAATVFGKSSADLMLMERFK